MDGSSSPAGPVRDLWRALRPQLIPVIAVLLIGAFGLDWWWTVPIVLAVLAAVAALALLEGTEGRAALREALGGVWLVLIAVVLIGSALLFVLGTSDEL